MSAKTAPIPFQSPHEDSFFSDPIKARDWWAYGVCFNPLTRIRSFLTEISTPLSTLRYSFNPLTRIRSFLTDRCLSRLNEMEEEFQSPHEDSFFSDAPSAG